MAFLFKRSLVVTAAQVPAAQINFPALVYISDPTFKTFANGGRIRNVNGYDIKFYADTLFVTQLDHEIESYDGVNGILRAWVRIPTLTNATVIYVGYGDVSITVSGENKPGVWDANYKGVWHLPNGTVLTALDSTGINNGTLVNTPTAATGQVGGGANFVAASTQYINLGSLIGLNPSAITFSAWVKAASLPAAYNAVVMRGATAAGYYEFFVLSTGKIAAYVRAAANVSYDGSGSHTLSTGVWYYVTVVYSSTVGLIGYVNAAFDGSAGANGTLTSTTASAYIGNDALNSGRTWNGVIDEVRISDVVRSANWIAIEYNNMLNQTGGSAFWSLGSEGPIITIPTGIVYPDSLMYEVILSGTTWTDITRYVVQTPVDVMRGITGNGPLDSIAEPGTCRFVVRNDTPLGLFSPGNAACMAGWTFDIPFRLRINYFGVPYTRFRGKVRSILPDTGRVGRRQVFVVAYDHFKDLAEADLREIDIQINKTESETISAILDALPLSSQPPSRSIDTGIDVFKYALADIGSSPKALSVIADVARSSFMLIANKGDGTFVARSRQTRTNGANTFTFSGDFLEMKIPSALDGVYNLIRITIHPPIVDLLPTTVLYSLIGPVPGIAPNETQTFGGKFNDPTNAQRLIGGIDKVVPLVAGTDYAGNSKIDGTGTNVTASLSVATSAFAADVKFVVTNTSSSTIYLIGIGDVSPRLQIRGRAVRDLGPQTFQAPSTTPTGSLRPLDIDQRYQSDAYVAQALATYIQAVYSNLNRQMDSLTFIANESHVKMLLAMSVEPGDLITVTEVVSGVSAAGAIVQSVALRISEKVVMCTLGLAPSNVFIFWQWDTPGRSEWNFTTVYGI